jgi:hypothetical protein
MLLAILLRRGNCITGPKNRVFRLPLPHSVSHDHVTPKLIDCGLIASGPALSMISSYVRFWIATLSSLQSKGVSHLVGIGYGRGRKPLVSRWNCLHTLSVTAGFQVEYILLEM